MVPADSSEVNNIIMKGSWLNDQHIDSAQSILKKQFPSISGFQACCAFEAVNYSTIGVAEGKWVQIFNVGSDHWICISVGATGA